MKITDTRLQNFRKIMSEKNLRLMDIAELLGKAPAQVSAFGGKNPTKGIGDQIAREIEKALHLTLGSLDVPYGFGTLSAAAGFHLPQKLPVLGPVAAIDWCKSHQAPETTTEVEWIDAPGPVGPHSFILRVEGMSMEPKFTEGDKIVVDPSLDISPGHYVVAKRKGEGAVTLKQLRQEGGESYLYALNPNWPEKIVKITEDWHICGRARWKISDL